MLFFEIPKNPPPSPPPPNTPGGKRVSVNGSLSTRTDSVLKDKQKIGRVNSKGCISVTTVLLFIVMIGTITFSAQNVNSLNMSHAGKDLQRIKLYTIAKLKSDFIFLSDVRLTNKAGKSALQDVKNTFLINPYEKYNFEYNSSKNSRGVAILIKRSLNFSEIARIADTGENFLLLLLEDSTGNKLIIGSIYGPNNYDPEFFERLERGLRILGNHPTVLGGDFNCTVSVDPINLNIDCQGMNSLPNSRHSQLLENLCTDLNLMDP